MDQIKESKDNQELNGALAVGEKIELLMVKVLSSRSLTQNAVLEQFISTMAVRCLNFLRATLLLSRQGLVQPTASCVRSLIEQRWVFEAVAAKATRDEALKRLFEHGEYNRKNACKNLRALENNERDQRITNEALSQVEASLDVEAEYHSLKRWAELAKRSSEYLTAYALLCSRTHPTIQAIENHLLFDDSGRVLSVTANPEIDSLPRDVLQACEVMIDVIAASPDSWQTKDVVTEVIELRQRIYKLWESVPDPLMSINERGKGQAQNSFRTPPWK